jgi:hypothetical protein
MLPAAIAARNNPRTTIPRVNPDATPG